MISCYGRSSKQIVYILLYGSTCWATSWLNMLGHSLHCDSYLFIVDGQRLYGWIHQKVAVRKAHHCIGHAWWSVVRVAKLSRKAIVTCRSNSRGSNRCIIAVTFLVRVLSRRHSSSGCCFFASKLNCDSGAGNREKGENDDKWINVSTCSETNETKYTEPHSWCDALSAEADVTCDLCTSCTRKIYVQFYVREFWFTPDTSSKPGTSLYLQDAPVKWCIESCDGLRTIWIT